MKKTLSLLLALVMVIGLFPVFADEAPALTAEEAGAVLQGYGAIKGDSNGDLMIDKELKRQDAVVILTRLMGKDKEVEAMPKETKASFEDITIDYYQPFLAFAESNKWIEGKAEKKFGFNDVVTVKEFSAMLLRALGHDTMGENYAKVMDLAKEQGLFKGAMVEENANLVRGIAFILMNNTLETAPKGEDKALVYKLGYKEEPKPENLTVVSAEAAGLKAIDVKFSKAVDEKSLKGISVKDGSKKVTFEVMLLDEMTARLVLNAVAKQDAKYTVTVDGVKSADMTEAVEKYEAAVFMTDAARPEVLSVEALNPKTLLVKTSEPITKETTAFVTLQELKIEGKALVGKVFNAGKNEITVELYKVLKAGDYKIEVSSLKDYAGFIAKTAEFDFTVVEDKDAPVVVSASMETLTKIKVVFDEPLSAKGKFKVDTNTINSSKITLSSKDKKVVFIEVPALGMGAITEVSVQYKDQKDAVGNMVKDFVKFTFKVEDDTTLPEVKSVELDGTDIIVTFTKKMADKGSFTLKKGNETKISKQAVGTLAKFDAEDAAVLKIDAKSVLDDQNAADYTLILEGFIDGTVRKNEMAKAELSVAGKDTKAPQVANGETYALKAKNTEHNLQAVIYFTEEMDEATLLNASNYIFNGYNTGSGAAATRADVAKVDIKVEELGKKVTIEANDEKATAFGDIVLNGLKDKAGNYIKVAAGKVAKYVGANNTMSKAEFIKDNDIYLIKLTFEHGIPVMDNRTYKLEANAVSLNMKHSHQNEDGTVHYFNFDQTDVGADAKKGTHLLTLGLNAGDADKSPSIFGQDAPAAIVLADMVKPSVVLNEDGTLKYTVKNSKKELDIEFNEAISATKTDHVLSYTDKDGNGVILDNASFDIADNVLTLKVNGGGAFPDGIGKLTIISIKDKAAVANIAVNLGTFDVEIK